MNNKHNPYLRLFTRDIEGSPKINALSMAASGLYFRLLNRFNEPPMPGSLALHDWEVHHTWQRSLTQQCLAASSDEQRLLFFAKYLSRIFQWKSADILKALQELYFFGIVVVEGDRLIQPRMYKDNGYKLQRATPNDAEIDAATGAASVSVNLSDKSDELSDKTSDKNNDKKSDKKSSIKNIEKTSGKNGTTHARGHLYENEYENNNEDNNVINKAEVEKTPKTKKPDAPTFNDFWALYDKKCGRGKTKPLWNKLSRKDREAIMIYVPKYKEAQPEKRYRKDPATFLRNRAWEDEIIPSDTITPSSAGNPSAGAKSGSTLKQGVQVTETKNEEYNEDW